MRINIIGYQYRPWDGYGRYATHLGKALIGLGHQVRMLLAEQCNAPSWMHEQWGIDWSAHAVSILPPFYLQSTPKGSGPHWLLSMTEGSLLPSGWKDMIEAHNIERVIVPCRHNKDAFVGGGIRLPISVVPGGTDPEEFPLYTGPRPDRPYTFMAIADRGARKGWAEAWAAFFKAFGSPSDTPDVRLVIKSRKNGNDLLELISNADNPDPRVSIIMSDMDMGEFYRSGDCFVSVSRSEGWGMLPREAAMTGLPVIVQLCSGIDDGHTDQWALVVEGGQLERIPSHFEHIAGEWLKADIDALATMMRRCYELPSVAASYGRYAASWLRDHQTWDHAAQKLLALIGEHHGADH